MIDKQKVTDIFSEFCSRAGYQGINSEEIKYVLFIKLFNNIPIKRNIRSLTEITSIDIDTTIKNIINDIKFDQIIDLGFQKIFIKDNLIFQACYNDHRFNTFDFGEIYALNEELIDQFRKYIVKEDELKCIQYVTYNNGKFECEDLKVNNIEVNLELNYNDDLPDATIKSILKADESGIVILHGTPGTGKTHYLRHLIYNLDKPFLFIDSSCFAYITDASFIDLLLNHKNSIIVIEDCETLLQARTSGNGLLSALLNLSDGILGDSLRLKFICTFNAKLNKIDEAVLRQGRLKLKYEFKSLTSEKVSKLCKALNKEVPCISAPLCDIYNTENNGGKEQIRRVGF